jgi:hypothetical protein
MELKLTTKRALAYEQKTGIDIITKLESIAKEGSIKIKDVVDLFEAMGENYTVEMFDQWDKPFVEKANDIVNAILIYAQGATAGK